MTIKLGVSSCLLGNNVRYDGGHKYNDYLNDVVKQHFELVALCPEVAIGLSTPREPIRLVRRGKTIRVVGVKDPQLDVTDRLITYADKVANQFSEISGYIAKKNSPSCGMVGVIIYSEGADFDKLADHYIYEFMSVLRVPQ